MPPARTKRPVAAPARPVSITAVVDCVGMLAARASHGHLYLYDTNRIEGSDGLGSEELRTRVRHGDRLIWNVIALECETYAAIDGIEIDPAVCEPVEASYPDTDITYWTAIVKGDDFGTVPYRIRFRVGTRTEPITTSLTPALVHRPTEEPA